MTDPLLQQLQDIHGVDPLPWWYLAPGWWLAALAVLLVAVVLWSVFGRILRRIRFDWRRDARIRLLALRRELRRSDAKTLAAALSELLRRIAMARFGRAACAGLSGERWLAWLEQHDPRGFRWLDHGRLLIELPYAPEGHQVDPRQLRKLVSATLPWVRAEAPAQRPPRRRWFGLRRLPAAVPSGGTSGV